MDTSKQRNILVLLGIVVAISWLSQFLWELGSKFGVAILIFLLAWVVSFIISPIVRRLEQTHLPRLAATILVYLLVSIAGVAITLFIFPLVLSDLASLTSRLGQYGDEVQDLADDVLLWLRSVGLPESALEDAISDLGSNFADLGANALARLIDALTSIVTAVLVSVLTLIVSFYVVLDWDRSLTKFENSLPGFWGAELREAVHTIEKTFTGFLRGQLIESALFGVAVAIAMLVSGLDYVVVISIFSGMMLVIPFVGPILGLLAPVLVALLESPVTALGIGLSLLATQVILENVLKPRIISSAVGVHPLVVIAGVLVGTTAAGFWGAVFGVPFGALLYFALEAGYTRWVCATSRIDADDTQTGSLPDDHGTTSVGTD